MKQYAVIMDSGQGTRRIMFTGSRALCEETCGITIGNRDYVDGNGFSWHISVEEIHPCKTIEVQEEEAEEPKYTYTQLVKISKAQGNNLAYLALGRMMDTVEKDLGFFPAWDEYAPKWIADKMLNKS